MFKYKEIREIIELENKEKAIKSFKILNLKKYYIIFIIINLYIYYSARFCKYPLFLNNICKYAVATILDSLFIVITRIVSLTLFSP